MFHAQGHSVVVVRQQALHRIAQHGDQLRVRDDGGCPLGNGRVEQVIGGRFAREESRGRARIIRARRSWEVPSVPTFAAVEREIEEMDLLGDRRTHRSMLTQILIEGTRAGFLCTEDEEGGKGSPAAGGLTPALQPRQDHRPSRAGHLVSKLEVVQSSWHPAPDLDEEP